MSSLRQVMTQMLVFSSLFAKTAYVCRFFLFLGVLPIIFPMEKSDYFQFKTFTVVMGEKSVINYLPRCTYHLL